jgi:hypothetical protein
VIAMKKSSCILIVLLLLSLSLTSCGLSPTPRPEIKSGEFNFSFTYEYAGETKTVSGVYVCEYDGIDWVLDGGFHREWSGYIKGETTEENIILGTAEDGGVVEIYLAFDPDLFMGDSPWEDDEPFVPCLSVRLMNEGLYFESDPEILAETYGARIISYEYDEPIENTFK